MHKEMLEFLGVSKRSIFIIDKDTVIRYKWISEDPSEERDYKAIDEILSEIP